MQQSSATQSQDVGIGLQKIVACSHSSSQCQFKLISFKLSNTIFSIQVTYTGLRGVRACNNLPQPNPYILGLGCGRLLHALTPPRSVGIGLWKIVACSHSSSKCLLVSTVFGMDCYYKKFYVDHM